MSTDSPSPYDLSARRSTFTPPKRPQHHLMTPQKVINDDNLLYELGRIATALEALAFPVEKEN